ncbi:hypothetical protein NM04_18735 [Massilia aurea]|uniref:Peptidase C58 YopT-type domain-containing protein n=1 Tax=Massilia aurea TaxID=373040 RepID=A0A422QH43_9BURK|nr:hypothetical protein [Massilia aurea]RNF29280.1 hypothetical protein NM04_18735 [Massilia aurea]
MDYSNSTGVRIMTPIARDARCDYQPFAQMALLDRVQAGRGALADGAGGVCYGLAVAWLETMAKKDGDFLDQVADLEHSSTFYRAYTAHRHQEVFGAISTSGKWFDGDPYAHDTAHRDQFFGRAALTQGYLVDAGKSRSFGLSLAGMKAFCAWISAAFDKRFFMVSVPGHAMAAIGSRAGKNSFFDPNCGVVSSSSSSALAACLYDYFSNATIKTRYRGDAMDWLTAEKYKA